MTACVHILHKRCGGVIGTATPFNDAGVMVVLNEHVVEGLDEIRKALPPHGDRRSVAGVWQSYPTSDAMPTRFTAWCGRCDEPAYIDGADIAAKVARVRGSGKDQKLRV